MPKLGSVEDIIQERERWIKFDAEQADLTKWEYFCYGIAVGSLGTVILFFTLLSFVE